MSQLGHANRGHFALPRAQVGRRSRAYGMLLDFRVSVPFSRPAAVVVPEPIDLEVKTSVSVASNTDGLDGATHPDQPRNSQVTRCLAVLGVAPSLAYGLDLR